MFKIIFLVATLTFTLLAPAKSNEKHLPIEQFVRDDEHAQPRMSPDGKYLALTVRIPINGRDVPTVIVYSLHDMKQVGAVRMPAFEVPDAYQWVSNTRLLVTKAKEIGSQERPYVTGEIFAMDYNGENQEYIYGYQEHMRHHGSKYGDYQGSAEIVDIPPQRDGHFYMSTKLWDGEATHLFYVNAKNASRKLITSIALPYATFVLQHNGTPRFAYGMDKENYTTLFRYDDKNDRWIHVPFDENGGSLIPIAFNADDTEFYAYFRKKGEPMQIVRQNFSTGARVSLLTSPNSEFDLNLYAANQSMPFAFGSQIGVPSVQYLDSASSEAKLHQLLSSKFQQSFIQFVSHTDDNSKLIFSVSSDKEPGAYYLYDKKSGKAGFLFATRQMIDPDTMAERRPIKFKTKDGVEIHGYLTIPQHADPSKKMAMVVLPHGGPHGIADHWFYDNDAQFLASRGYAVLQVNFRGSGGKGSAFRLSGYRQWGGAIQDDILEGIRWSIKEANIDANRICTYGASFGGYSALMLAAREPALFKCAIGYVGVYDLNLMFKSDEMNDPRYVATITRYLGNDKEELDRFSPAKQAEKIKIPVMLIHGKEDKRAPFAHAEAMRDALIKQGRPPEWMAVDGEGHGFYNTKTVQEFYQRLEAFLRKHIGE